MQDMPNTFYYKTRWN